MKKSRFSTRLSDGCAHNMYLFCYLVLSAFALALYARTECKAKDEKKWTLIHTYTHTSHNSCGNFKVIIMLHLQNRFNGLATFTGFRFSRFYLSLWFADFFTSHFLLFFIHSFARYFLFSSFSCVFFLYLVFLCAVHMRNFVYSCEHAHYFFVVSFAYRNRMKILKFVHPISIIFLC